MNDQLEVFHLELSPPNLIVIPQGSSLQFLYNDVQIESNKILNVLNEPEYQNVIIDLSQVHYLDTIIISTLTRLVQQASQTGGQAVFCNACTNMEDILKRIKVGSYWPLFELRDSALAYINSEC
ncbi:STAS domain-containing protein [Gimesia sp.]|uniref:STAS domain-containing protein n=1 Tax=Gimesia sp. TaxID=2024833 RepID=UPI003A8DE5F0